MGSQTLEILRQGVWASLTGGWFFDPHQEIFTNTFHFYLWIILLCLPFSLYLGAPPSNLVWALYAAFVGILFAVIKFLNYRLHLMFDGEEFHSEDDQREDSTSTRGISRAESVRDSVRQPSVTVRREDSGLSHGQGGEVIEMEVINQSASADCNDGREPDPNISHHALSTSLASSLLNQLQPLEHNTEQDSCELSNKITDDSEEKRKPARIKEISFALEAPTSDDSDDSSSQSPSGKMKSQATNTTRLTEKDTPETHEHSQFESMTSFKSEQSQEPGQTCSDQILNSESKGELSDTLSSLSSYPIPIMENAIFEARSAPGLTVGEIWEPNVSSPKSEGSAISISSNPCTTLEAVAAALENFDHTRKTKVTEASPEFKDEDGQPSTSGIDSFSKEITDQGTSSVSRQESQREFGQHRPRSISDIVRETKQDNKETSGSGAESGRDSPAPLDASSLHDSCKLRNPSMSSQPESLDSTSVCIAMNNKDTASTATQTGSLCEAEGSGREGSELILARRSSQLARRRRRLQRHSVRRRRRTDSGPGTGPFAEVLLQAMDTAPQSAHVAASHNDTTPGALHCYQDEFGQWQTYMFEGDGPVSTSLVPVSRSSSHRERGSNWETSSSSSTFVVEHSMEAYDDLPPVDIQRAISQRRWHDTLSSSSIPVARPSSVTPVEKFSVPHYFKFQIIPNKFIKIKFDRLTLLALMDRNKSIFEALASVVLAVLVAVLGYWLLVKDFFKDFWIFLFCFIIASCQFSLLKSVQPDAASPTHGHNHVVVFSRPVYFVCLATIVLILDRVMQTPVYCLTLYSLPLCTNAILIYTRDFLIGFILGFPLLFLIGLLPQVNTFAMYLLEQIDMHVFGGNAMTSLRGSVVSVLRSILATAVLYGFCYGAMLSEMGSQHVLYSIFSGLLVAISYHLSRTATDPTVLISLLRSSCLESNSFTPEADFVDPLPEKLKRTVTKRLQNDLVCSIFILIFVFAIHVSTVFTALQPYVGYAMYSLAGAVGIVNHYIWPQLRKPLPWLCFAVPFFKSREFNQFEVRDAAKIMRFEKAQVWLNFIERNIVYPAVFLSALTEHSKALVDKFGILVGPIIICVIGLKLLRSAFSDSSRQHMILIFTLLFFKFDFGRSSETLLVDYFFMSIFMSKFYELILKVRFIVTYIAPWQITWGSAFHAFAQPFSVPHSAMLFFQAIVSSIFSAPLNPVLGSAIFITSYVRPVKFWEKDYNTNRVDHSNTRLSSQLDRNPGSDDNNLNSIFYEHLTRSLQHSLCGDLMLGRWGPVSTGDCFVLASDYLNALVHIIEVGNGLVTFQLRGLEFRGTYCQQREVEAITEGVEDDNGCCCCEPGHLPNLLSLNAAFGQRWLAWEVTSTKYIIEGYSISDNSAASMLQVFDLRKILVTYYVKSVIFYAMRSNKLDQWLANETLIEAISSMHDPAYVDLDSCFYSNIDEDYDLRQGGISRSSFLMCYLEWIQYCGSRRQQPLEAERDSTAVTLCFALCLLARRALGTASHQQSASLESFLYGLHALFKGDFRITSLKDEWVFADVDFLRKVVAPGVRMSLKLHQDHFSSMDDYDDYAAMYEAITNHEQNMVISHEGDPAWRQAVLANTPSLLALRHVFDDGADEYKIIMLNKRYLSFRVIKVNRECVRGLWAGQLQELIFLRNRNPERGSIQNAKQALRNIINSSCDQPIGYPIYVSPLTTSYVDSNAQLSSVIGGPMSFNGIRRLTGRLVNRFRARCGASCHSGGDPSEDVIPDVSTTSVVYTERFSSFREGTRSSALRTSSGRLPRTNFSSAPVGFRSSTRSGGSQISGSKRPSTAVNITQPSSQSQPQSSTNVPTEGGLNQKIRIIDIGQVYDTINLGRRIDVQWPSEYMRERGGKNNWKDWHPTEGMEGVVIHKWQPCHRDITQRSHVDRTILLVKIDDKFVPIAEAGVTEIGYEV